MRHAALIFLCISLLGLAPEASLAGAQSAEIYNIELDGDPGAGNPDCAGPRMTCIRVAADAWCESHGHGPLRRLWPADDQTASLKQAADAPPRKRAAFMIVCDP